jgi:hypothetical protein
MARITASMLVTGLMLVAAASFGATAFTSATVERQANVDIVNDNAGLLALTDGNSGNLVFQDANGQLAIDFEKGTATGANVNATFELGNPADPSSSQAFNITNQDDESHQINVLYEQVDNGNTDENLNISVYNDKGNIVDSATEEGKIANINADAGQNFNVVITVDTGGGGVSTNLENTDDLSGTISVTIDDVDNSGQSDGS